MSIISDQKVKDFIEKQNWIFAKTYSDRAPHEYVVRGKLNGTDEEFLEIVDYIQKTGITMYFWNHPNKYIFVDNCQYWVMSGEDGNPVVLNRFDLDQYKLTITWKGNSENGR